MMAIDVDKLKKISKEPVAKLVSTHGFKLETDLDLPPVAGVEAYLTGLDEKGAQIDTLKLLAMALPPREAVWWACLAAEDVVGGGEDKETPSLRAAKAWVYKPDKENREAVRIAIESAEFDDPTKLCATAAFYGSGTAGGGVLEDQPAPAAALPASVFGQNISALDAHGDDVEATFDLLIRRALDIARGGNGKAEELMASKPKEVE